MPALYEIADARVLLNRLVDEQEGELSAELEAELDLLDGAFEEKAERCALWIKEQLDDCESIRAEETRLMKRRHALFNATESLRAYLTRQMLRVGKEKVRGLLATISLRHEPITLEGELQPHQLIALFGEGAAFVRRVPESYELDRRALLTHVRAGGAVPAGMITKQETSVSIR